jgi:4-amino-4-deoxy-L-arabinose transferase-like glycosyltransferase
MLGKIRRWIASHPNWTLTLVTLAVLLPFVAKPFNMDDPLFIWAAKQIQLHPANPYGFNVDWSWTTFPMWNVTENPPLTCYFIALWARIFGWSELSLHFLFLIPSTAAILGTHRLARHFCNSPMPVALATLFTPVFLISSTAVTCDVWMLAFWIWAVGLWLEGMEQKDFRWLAICSLLATLAPLTKYFGLCLVPLLAFHGIIHERRCGQWCFYLMPPLLAVVMYQLATLQIYGRPLVGAAMDWANFTKGLNGFSKWDNILVALAFVGGCTAPAIFFAPMVSKLRTLVVAAAIAVVFAATIFSSGLMSEKYAPIPASARLWIEIQVAFWAAAGIWILTLAAAETLRRKDASSWLLGFWIWGTFLFAAVFNWTVNGRSILPLTPAAAILIFRQLGENSVAEKIKFRFTTAALCAGAALALLVAQADFRAAATIRKCAQWACAQAAGQTLWFQGHWGFQFYMQAGGALPVDFRKSVFQPGDKLAVPSNNTNLLPLDPKKGRQLAVLALPETRWLSTMNTATGAGFYASMWGPLPFAFGRAPPERVFIYELGVPDAAHAQDSK